MSRAPAGTITFLFSDIEGSTKLLQHLGENYNQVLDTHRRILRAAFEQHHGHVIGTEGDSFFVVFARATDALGAAIQGQRSLRKHGWPKEAEIRVRVGLHTGEARLVEGDYVGLAVHEASRISALGYGGQILVSGSTRELVEGDLPAGATLKDLGDHRLKDLVRPQRLFQVCHPELLADFPLLRSLQTRRHNLPAQFTTFIGREKEFAELKKLVSSAQLVTITGAGGSGKTRLALEVAADLLDEHPDGVWMVDLASVVDPELVLQEVASSLGVREEEGRPLESTLNDFLADKKLLLVLDNCEHLVAECGRVADQILRVSPASRITVTTREALGVSGEVAWRMPSMSVPDAAADYSIDELSANEAVQLFLERASHADPSFTLTSSDIPFMIQICLRLDGIPLAIELAAARVKVLSLKQIAERLDDRFRLLTGGSKSSLPRQQTLRALVDWSYALLSESERAVIMRASVFAGGFDMEAVESVCSGEDISEADVLDNLTALVDKSLVVMDRGGEVARFRFLETIRQYCRQKLFDSESASEARDAHLEFFLAFTERAEALLQGSDQKKWLDHLELEHDNLRAALEWSASDEGSEKGLRLASALWRFWWVRGHWSEARRWLDKLLSGDREDVSLFFKAKALWAAGFLARFQTDYALARSLSQQSLEMFRRTGEASMIAYPIFTLGHTASSLGEREEARSQLKQSLAIGREFDDKQVMAWSLLVLGSVDARDGRHEQARSAWEEALNLARAAGDRWNVAMALNNIGGLAILSGDYSAASSLHSEALEMRLDLGDKFGLVQSLLNLGNLSEVQGDYGAARSYLEEGIAIARNLGDKDFIQGGLLTLGSVALAQGDSPDANGYLEEAVTIARGTGNDTMLANVLNAVAWIWHLFGRDPEARGMAEESVTICRKLESEERLVAALHTLGEVLRSEGHLEEAAARYSEGLGCKASGSLVAPLLEGMAGLAGLEGRLDRAARLFGAAESLRDSEGFPLTPQERALYDQDVAKSRASGVDAFEESWNEGRKLSSEEAVSYALEAGN